jgi:endonuclease/exonuclease/phosphatase (EEP) superfamily protein YafD
MEDDEHPIWTALLKTLLVLAILALASGYLGWLHPIGDSLSVGRAYAAGAVAFLALLSIRSGLMMAAFGSLLLALIVGIQVALSFYWPGPPGSILLYQKNMKFRNSDLAGLEADIRAVAPMALTLQEVSEANLTLLEALQDTLPHQHVCPFAAVGGTAVASRLVPVPGGKVCDRGLAAMQVVWPGSRGDVPVWIVSIHLHWPWPYGQAEQVTELRRALAKLDGPVLMAGDFNMVRWAHSVTAMAQSARAMPAGPSRGTFLGFGPALALPIDHAFAPNGGRIRLRGAHGSDHLGFTAELEP